MRINKLFASVLIGFTGLISMSFLVKTTSNSKTAIHHSPFTIDTLQYPEESHFKNIQQLTFGGDNAEAYFSFDGKWIVFQRTQPKEGIKCDQIFVGKVPANGEKFEYKMISTGKGRTTCAAFTKDGKHILPRRLVPAVSLVSSTLR